MARERNTTLLFNVSRYRALQCKGIEKDYEVVHAGAEANDAINLMCEMAGHLLDNYRRIKRTVHVLHVIGDITLHIIDIVLNEVNKLGKSIQPSKTTSVVVYIVLDLPYVHRLLDAAFQQGLLKYQLKRDVWWEYLISGFHYFELSLKDRLITHYRLHDNARVVVDKI